MAKGQRGQGDPGNVGRRQSRSYRRSSSPVHIGYPLAVRSLSWSKSGDAGVVGRRIRLDIHDTDQGLPQIRAGRIKPYAITAKSRMANAPNVPTTDEAGLPGFYLSYWHGLWAPRGTPKEIISKINEAAVAALAEPPVRARLAELGQQIFSRASKRRKRWALCRRPRFRSGGLSSRKPASNQKDDPPPISGSPSP